jgi:hypothetical protein
MKTLRKGASVTRFAQRADQTKLTGFSGGLWWMTPPPRRETPDRTVLGTSNLLPIELAYDGHPQSSSFSWNSCVEFPADPFPAVRPAWSPSAVLSGLHLHRLRHHHRWG